MNSTTPRSLNLPLIGLWVASVAIVVLGVVLMFSSNAAQVTLYAEQSADTGAFLSAQSNATVGGLLIAVGVLGLVISLATQALIGAADRRHAASVVEVDEFDALDGDDDDLDVLEAERVPGAAAAPAAVAPVAEATPATEAAAAEAEPATEAAPVDEAVTTPTAPAEK